MDYYTRIEKGELTGVSDASAPNPASFVFLAFFLGAGVNHLRRVLAIFRVHPEPLWRHFLSAFSPLVDEDTGVHVLGDGRRTLDKGAFHSLQLGLGL